MSQSTARRIAAPGSLDADEVGPGEAGPPAEMPPLAGATRLREPFAWLLFIPAAVILLVLLYQYLASVGVGHAVPVLRLLIVPSDYHGSLYVAVESAFAAYMLAFSIRTGRGI